MGLSLYLGERFAFTHENDAFNFVCQKVRDHWQHADEQVALIGNVTCHGHELDALLLKPDGIIVIDFKNHGGQITFTENGPWRADDHIVKGGSKDNPFKQIQANKFGLLNWLKDHCSAIAENNHLGHINGLVVFQKPIQFDRSQLPGKVASWFNVTDLANVIRCLDQIASPKINLKPRDLHTILKELNVAPYHLPDDAVSIQDIATEPPAQPLSSFNWTPAQGQALKRFKALMADKSPDALLIKGMTSTGKTTLVSALSGIANAHGKEVVALSPNAALAAQLTEQSGIEFRSLYGHIYDLGAQAAEDADEIIVHPLRPCADATDAVYFIDEAHLLNNAYFDFGNERFGSGHLVDDLLKFIAANDEGRRLVLIGDPFQVARASQNDALLNAEMLEARGRTSQEFSLENLIDDGSRSDLLALAVEMVRNIRSEDFQRLDIQDAPPQLKLLANEDKREALQHLFSADKAAGIFLAFSNKTAYKVTQWLRSEVFQFKNERPQAGDRIELYNLIQIENADDPTQPITLAPGAQATVEGLGEEVVTEEQALRGRDIPVLLRFRQITLVFDRYPSKSLSIWFFEPFLYAERPEIDSDTIVALRVFAEQRVAEQLTADKAEVRRKRDRLRQLKAGSAQHAAANTELDQARNALRTKRAGFLRSDPFLNAARLRFAYASTCHHAQGRHWEDVMVDASYDGQGRTNEAYFRWLYTAITRAKRTLRLANFSPISPLDGVQLRTERTSIDPALKSTFQFTYAKDALPSDNDKTRPIPKGFEKPTIQLINLWLKVERSFEPSKLQILAVEQFPFQERYTFSDESGRQAKVALHYNGNFDVTSIKGAGGDPELLETALASLEEPLHFAEPVAQKLLDCLREVFVLHNLRVEGGQLHSWQMALTIRDTDSHRALVRVYYSKAGNIRTIEIDKATDAKLPERIKNAVLATTGRANAAQ